MPTAFIPGWAFSILPVFCAYGTSSQIIKDDPQFRFERRGKVQAKGKGRIEMYFVSLDWLRNPKDVTQLSQ